MTIWTARGKDASGADTHMTTNLHGTFLITDHKTGGVRVYRIVGLAKELQAVGLRDVEAAKRYVDREFLRAAAPTAAINRGEMNQ